jgi:hypothetical protein
VYGNIGSSGGVTDELLIGVDFKGSGDGLIEVLSLPFPGGLRKTTAPQSGYQISRRANSTGWTAGVQFLAGTKEFSRLQSVQTASGAHPVSYPMGNGDTFPGGKAAGV